jgi:hypothetical protein
MKKVSFLLLIALTFSCGKDKGSQMLYDYNSDIIKEMFSTNLEELDFKVNSIEKIGEIKSSDSIKILKEKLVLTWFGEDATQKEKDTLSFEFVTNKLESLTDKYQEIILSNISLDEDYKNYEYTEKRDKNILLTVNIRSWKNKFDSYSKKPDSILSVKYNATYSLTNPLLKIKQTHNNIYYTNAEQTKFIELEKVK